MPAIVALLADDELGASRETPGQPLPAAYWRAFEEIERDPADLLLVAVDGGRLLGTLHLTFIPSLTFVGGRRAQIEAVRVASSARGAGTGRALVGWAVDEARRRGCRLVQLTSHRSRTDAHRFYAALGFEATHVGMKLFLDGDGEAGGQR